MTYWAASNGSFCSDLDGFTGLPEFEDRIDRNLLLHIDRNFGLDESLETACFGLQATPGFLRVDSDILCVAGTPKFNPG